MQKEMLLVMDKYKKNYHFVSLRSVCFHYLDAKPVLEDVSFKVAAGTSTAVVGATGSGKSTLAKLMFRFFDPVEGEVVINERNIKSFTQKSFRFGSHVYRYSLKSFPI